MRHLPACCAVWLVLGSLCSGAAGAPQAHPLYEPLAPAPDLGPNLLLKAPVKASPHWSTCVPQYAVDGRHDNPGQHWAAENLPVSLTVELPEPRQLNLLRLWTFWDNRRYYQYVIEGSLDGETWAVLADRRQNTTPQTEAGEAFLFPETSVRYVRTTFTHNSAGQVTGGHIVELEGYHLERARAEGYLQAEQTWQGVEGLRGGWGALDTRYARDEAPPLGGPTATAWSAVAWRGERVHNQLLLWSGSGATQVRARGGAFKGEGGAEIPAVAARVAVERYVLADGKLVADVLDPAERWEVPAHSTRPLWVSVQVPPEARPGRYTATLEVLAAGKIALPFEISLEVLPQVLPPPSQWRFRLDLWQNPFALARYHGVPLWSEEHWRLLEPHLRLLAEAGQKCLTTSIIRRPWGTQTYDPYESMIGWCHRADGTWSYDYSIFDRYVELGRRCGITDSINCYTLSSPQYLEEATGDYTTGGYPLQEIWRPFLKDFLAHLQAKGWLGRTAIAMDEWPLERMRPMIDFVREAAPGLKIALAGSNEPELADKIDDWCVFISPPLEPKLAQERAARNRPTTFYVCCGPGRPNTFTFSPPAEAAWLGWYAAAQGYSGLLRWAYDSWVQEPLYDTSYVTWPAGDCFLVYPGARSSVRFERLREGIQEYEKVRIVREKLAPRSDQGAHEALLALDAALANFRYDRVQKEPAAEAVNAARAALEAAARVAR